MTNSDEQLRTTAEVRPLQMNPKAAELWLSITKEHGADLLKGAENLAQKRAGDSIETGDVQYANLKLAKKTKHFYWTTLIGGALFGAGLRGLTDGIINQKPTPIVVYSICLAIGCIMCWIAMPAR